MARCVYESPALDEAYSQPPSLSFSFALCSKAPGSGGQDCQRVVSEVRPACRHTCIERRDFSIVRCPEVITLILCVLRRGAVILVCVFGVHVERRATDIEVKERDRKLKRKRTLCYRTSRKRRQTTDVSESNNDDDQSIIKEGVRSCCSQNSDRVSSRTPAFFKSFEQSQERLELDKHRSTSPGERVTR